MTYIYCVNVVASCVIQDYVSIGDYLLFSLAQSEIRLPRGLKLPYLHILNLELRALVNFELGFGHEFLISGNNNAFIGVFNATA